jgi:uncharacterized membrane protein YeaQ/YmgE (transglycosylase-associated protein family)
MPGLRILNFMTGSPSGGFFVGGLISRLFSKPADGAVIHPAGIMSIIGALILLYAWSHYAH